MLASGTQDRGFKPGRSRRIFSDVKIFSMPSFFFMSQICGTKKNPVGLRGSRIPQAKLFGRFTLEVPSFANRRASAIA
jgi:hypothetical protein